MILLRDARFRYEPYPIAVARSVFDPETYSSLVGAFPRSELFKFMGNIGNKWSLSEVNNPAEYAEVVKREPWAAFHAEVKSDVFIQSVIEFLRSYSIDPVDPSMGVLKSRFEFSILPADGGFLRPHTDIPSKIITLVLAMGWPLGWDGAWGGGTDVLRTMNPAKGYSHLGGYSAGFGDVETLETLPFVPNQAIVFVKTFNSWHCVRPMTGPKGEIRRTLTINIERSR